MMMMVINMMITLYTNDDDRHHHDDGTSAKYTKIAKVRNMLNTVPEGSFKMLGEAAIQFDKFCSLIFVKIRSHF